MKLINSQIQIQIHSFMSMLAMWRNALDPFQHFPILKNIVMQGIQLPTDFTAVVASGRSRARTSRTAMSVFTEEHSAKALHNEKIKGNIVVCFGEMLIDFVTTVGGACVNVAVGKLAFIGKVGGDEFGYALADILIEQPYKYTHLAAMEIAKQNGTILSYDPSLRLLLQPSPEAAREGIMRVWDQADIIKISEDEITFLAGGDDPYDDNVVTTKLFHPNLKLLLVTEGSDGCRYYTKDFHGKVQGVKVNAVDTSGAGDVFVSWLLWSLAYKMNLYKNFPQWCGPTGYCFLNCLPFSIEESSSAYLSAAGEAVAGGGKQKVVKAGGNNRRALGDIGNLVTVRGVEGGKPLPQFNRPVTRTFCAQLLANAQAQAAASDKNKKQVPVLVDVAVAGKPAVRKPAAVNGAGRLVAQRKVADKPKPEEIIEISPDTEDKQKEKPESHKASRGGGSSRKKVQTCTSVLTARSKAACAITNRPKETVVDIDAADAENQLAAVEYVEDIYKFYKLAENTSRVHDYMDSQPDINIKMRAILVDWLIEVHNKFELTPETLFLTIYIVDRYLSVKAVLRRELQLVGISAMLIASKYGEIWAPEGLC